MKVFVHTGELSEIRLSGSGDIDMGITCNTVDATISGSGRMELYGTAEDGKFRISGSGDIRAYDLTLQELDATITGSGSVIHP